MNSELPNIEQASEFNGRNFDEVEIVSEKLKHNFPCFASRGINTCRWLK
jgi:hypothetical protein